jgi:hypothetical protein
MGTGMSFPGSKAAGAWKDSWHLFLSVNLKRRKFVIHVPFSQVHTNIITSNTLPCAAPKRFPSWVIDTHVSLPYLRVGWDTALCSLLYFPPHYCFHNFSQRSHQIHYTFVYSAPHRPSFPELTGRIKKHVYIYIYMAKNNNWETTSTFHCRFVWDLQLMGMSLA